MKYAFEITYEDSEETLVVGDFDIHDEYEQCLEHLIRDESIPDLHEIEEIKIIQKKFVAIVDPNDYHASFFED